MSISRDMNFHNYVLFFTISSQKRKERELWKDDIVPKAKQKGRDLYKSPLYNERMYRNNQSESGPQGRTLSTIAGRHRSMLAWYHFK